MDWHALRAHEWRQLRHLRLRALRCDPRAFGSSFAQEAADPDGDWIEWAAESEEGTKGRTFVAAAGEIWQGMVFTSLADDGDAGLYGLWVDPAARRHGLAVALVSCVIGWATDRGAKAIQLSVADDNMAARSLFAAMNFVETGERRPLPSRPEIATLTMRRPLPMPDAFATSRGNPTG